MPLKKTDQKLKTVSHQQGPMRDSSGLIDESLLLSNMNFENYDTKRIRSPQREKLSKISQSMTNHSRQSGI